MGAIEDLGAVSGGGLFGGEEDIFGRRHDDVRDRRPVASSNPLLAQPEVPPARIAPAPASGTAERKKVMLSENAVKVLERRYLKKDEGGRPGEAPEDMFMRVAGNISLAELNYGATQAEADAAAERFCAMMTELDFLPNSPTLMNAGRELQQLSACFVLPVEDTMESIFSTIKNTALIHQSGGGTGFSFSRLRPANDKVASTGGVASGPVSFMRVFNAATEAVKQGGTRRGANMGILRVDHPDILHFINCKDTGDEYNNFNISVGITEAFMKAAEAGEDYDLVNPRMGTVASRLNAREVFGKIVELAWRTGDPGIVFLDRLNRDNPTPHIGEIESTNPCGEQPLLPYESCNLGSINLSNMVESGAVNWDKLRETTHGAVRFLDDVIDMNRYPLPEIDKMTRSNRKIGLGIMGFADMLIKLGIPYSSDEAVSAGREIMRFIDEQAKDASEELAKARGTFPNFKGSIYDRKGGRKLRNATVTTIAPTGTLSIIAGCSSGIEPLFAVSYVRSVMDRDELVEVNPHFDAAAREMGFYSPELMKMIAHHGTVSDMTEVPEDIRRLFVTAHDIEPAWHVKMQAAFQEHTDNAVSKTVNFSHDAKPADVEEVYMLAYRLGCKGVTIYRDGSKDEQVLSTGKTKEARGLAGADAKAQEPAPVHAEPGKIIPRPRPETTRGVTRQINTGCGRLYITINEDDKGLCELFASMGKSGGCATSQTEATGRLVSLALRAGVDPASIVDQLKGIRCPSPVWVQGSSIYSCADAIAHVLEEYLARKKSSCEGAKEYGAENLLNLCPQCPECGSMVSFAEGCVVCRSCGYSKCG
ncbi:MAG TPA: vitamin B12-dependent ribonucleotide reductase [Nitrospirota bacterium]|nr:vitamin B12-dependent ribonucleotide reductase [Nitrospirota bacterium]